MGWIETTLVSGVLNLVDDNRIIIVRGPSTYNISFIGGVLKSDFGQLSEKQKIVVYDGFGRVLFEYNIFVKKQFQIDLNRYFTKGLNFVRVFIENKFYDYYTFKIIKL